MEETAVSCYMKTGDTTKASHVALSKFQSKYYHGLPPMCNYCRERKVERYFQDGKQQRESFIRKRTKILVKQGENSAQVVLRLNVGEENR